MAKTANFPDGIDEEALKARGPSRVIAFRFAVFAIIMALAMLGLFGGRKAETASADGPAARFSATLPERLRNGNFFEIRFAVDARQPIADAVIAVPAPLFHEITMNSQIPEPVEEEFTDGELRYHLGPVEAGKSLQFKLDGQLNPPLFGKVAGHYRLLDGDRELVRVPAQMTVLP